MLVLRKVEIANALSEAFDDFLHRSANVGTVSKDNVHIRCLKTLE